MAEAYDAGTIRSTADLNRDPFTEGIKLCIAQGRDFASRKFTATADIDSAAARRDLARLQIMMRRVSEEGVNVRVDTAGIASAITELAALRHELDRVDRGVIVSGERQIASSRRVVAQRKEETKQLGLMRSAIEILGPPLVPLAGAAIFAGSAFVGLGVAGVAALKGITAEYKAGTPVGVQYAGMLRTVKDAAKEIGHTGAVGIQSGLNQALQRATGYLPAFNQNLMQSEHILGSIVAHVTGGLIGGLNTFNPLIMQAEQGANRLAGRFETWANGPGGAKFVQTLVQDMQHAGPLIANLFGIVTHAVAAFHPVGLGMLDTLTQLTSVINRIPVGVLQAATTAYIAFRASVMVTTGLNAAAGALTKLSAAETAAARSTVLLAASQRSAAGIGAGTWGATTIVRGAGAAPVAPVGVLERTSGALAVATRRLIPFAVGWVALTVGVNAARAATEKWNSSTNTLKAGLATTLNVAHDFLTFNWGNIANDVRTGYRAGEAATSKGQTQRIINTYSGIYTPSLGFGVDSTHPQGPQVGRGYNVARTGQVAGYSVQTLRAGRQELASYGQALDQARDRARTLNTEQQRLIASNQQGTAAWHANQQAIAENNRAGAAAAANYDRLSKSIQWYTKFTAANRAEQSKVRDSYVNQQANTLGGLQRNTFAQAGDVTSGIAGLQQYASVVQKAIKNEESWTKVTDDNTIKIGKNVYEMRSWNAAYAAANGNKNKAIGLLLGHSRALENDNGALAGAVTMQNRLSSAVGAAELKYKLNDEQLNLYAAALGVTAEQLATGEVKQNAFVRAVGQVKGVIDSGNTAMMGWSTAVAAFLKGTDTAATRASLLGAAMVSLNGDAIGYGVSMSGAASANQQFVTDFAKAHKSVINLKTGFIDFHRAAAAPLLSDLQSLQSAAVGAATATYQHERSIYGARKAAKDAADVYYNDTRNALINERDQLGLTLPQAKALADRYFHWPKKAETTIAALGADSTKNILKDIRDVLAYISGRGWNFTVDANTGPAQAKIDALRYNASRQIVLPVSGSKASAAGNIFTGRETHAPQIAGAARGTVRVWAEPETMGEAYIPFANDWRRPRAKDIVRTVARRFGGDVVGFAGGGQHGGFVGVTGGSGSSGSSGSGSSSSSSKSSRAAASTAAALTRLLRQIEVDQLSLKTLRELDKLGSSTLISYAQKLLAQAQKALDLKGADSALVKHVKAENTALQRELRVRDKLAQQRQAIDQKVAADRQQFKSEQSTVAQGILGGFDIGTSGNGYTAGIESTLDQQLADAKKFESLRNRAEKLGLDPRLLRQITREGPVQGGANLEALVRGGKAGISEVNKDYAELAKVANRLGGTQAQEIYGKRLAADTAKQRHIAEQQHAEMVKTNTILRELRHDLEKLKAEIKDAQRAHGGKR